VKQILATCCVLAVTLTLGCGPSAPPKPPASSSSKTNVPSPQATADTSKSPTETTTPSSEPAVKKTLATEKPAVTPATETPLVPPIAKVEKKTPSSTKAVPIDPALPAYVAVAADEVAGSIKSVGSDSMNNLMTLWLEDFKRMYPGVVTAMEGKGSATAPPALIAGSADFGPMSREMKPKEIGDFREKFGYEPTGLQTAIDMLAVYVHKDNPIAGLTFQQIDAIFSKTRKRGADKDIATWGDLGLTGEWANQPISLYGRNSASGTYGFFKEHTLSGGDFKDSVKEQPGSSAVVQSVGSDRFGIGYSGIGFRTSDVRAVPLAIDTGSDLVPAEPANAYDGSYPLARYLLVYFNYKPGSKLEPQRAEFIKFIFTQQGQQDVIKDGYLPVTSQVAQESLKAVGIEAAK
jgi:phosphate transport system substrate-binding protein